MTNGNRLESRRATAKHMKTKQQTSCKQNYQLRHQRVNLPLPKKKGKKRNKPYKTDQSEATSGQSKETSMRLPVRKYLFKQQKAIIFPNNYANNNRELSYIASKFYNKKVKTNFHLIDAQEMLQLETCSSSPYANLKLHTGFP